MFPLEQGAFEMMLIGALALIIVGPKDLPVLMRKVGQFTARMRAMAAEFRANFDELARQSELDELRREVEALRTGRLTAPDPPSYPLDADRLAEPPPAALPAPTAPSALEPGALAETKIAAGPAGPAGEERLQVSTGGGALDPKGIAEVAEAPAPEPRPKAARGGKAKKVKSEGGLDTPPVRPRRTRRAASESTSAGGEGGA